MGNMVKIVNVGARAEIADGRKILPEVAFSIF